MATQKWITAGVWCAAVFVLVAARSAETSRNEAVFQQDVNHYDGCEMRASYGDLLKAESGDVRDAILRFTKLVLPGNNIRIESVALGLRFKEEGFGQLANATIELRDAAEKDALPVANLRYSNKQFDNLDKKTRFVSLQLPVVLVERWMRQPETNKGLQFKVIPERQTNYQFFFNFPGDKAPAHRPKLAISYTFTGDIPPYAPDILTQIAGKTFGPRFALEWNKQPKWGPKAGAVVFEAAAAPEGGDFQKLAETDAEKLALELDTSKFKADESYRLRLRARDTGTGLASEWAELAGKFKVTREEYTIWIQDSVTKIGREEPPQKQPRAARLAAARGEYMSFQVVVGAFANIKDVDVTASELNGPDGAKIPASALALYRVHYVDCEGQGWLPDSLVPFVDPRSGNRIGGRFGAPFEVLGGTNAPVWAELHVPAEAAAGEYQGSIRVTVGGKEAAFIPVALTVWPVSLPATSTLLTYFELTSDTPKRDYLHALHQHRIDVWFINGLSHQLSRENGKPVVQWDAEHDKTLDAYFDGSLFADKVPGKSYHLPGGSWNVRDIVAGKSDEDRIEILKQFEARYKGKPYVGRLAWFFIDEPNPQTLIKCVRVGQQIKENSPDIKLFLTTRYNKDLLGLVGIWDPIINTEILDWNAPEPSLYRDEIAQGRMAINCITVCSNVSTSPNLFIQHKGMNTRIWTWATFALGLQGIEFWRSNAAPSVAKPVHYGDAWGDGSLFYRGLPEELGVAEELPLPSIRLKILRDGIEDFELLSLLAKKNPASAKKLCSQMVQETAQYDNSFALPVKHESYNWNTDGKGDRKVPGRIVWESSAERLAKTRAAIAAALEGK